LSQVKKPEIRARILENATDLFSAEGYHRTTLATIAKASGIAVGSIYSYFPSKLHLLYSLYRPWFEAQVEALLVEINELATPREKLRRLLLGLWRDIPAENIGLANSLMEALASGEPGTGKPDDLLRWLEGKLSAALAQALPAARRDLLDGDLLSHLLVMAQDGFVINRRLGDTREIEALVDIVCDMMLGEKALPHPFSLVPAKTGTGGNRTSLGPGSMPPRGRPKI
jgi:AcrR family transcriptional regulator